MKGFGSAVLVLGVAVWCGVAGATTQVPAGYRVAQQLPVDDGQVLEILEDARITPDLHRALWGNGSDPENLEDQVLAADVEKTPFVEAQVRLLAPSGEALENKSLGYPLASVEKAPLTGMPAPAFFLTIDETAPMGTYSGPATQVLMPSVGKLNTTVYRTAEGKSEALFLAQTGKAAWQVGAPAADGKAQIQQVSSSPASEDEEFVTTYRTYRFQDGAWQLSSRQEAGYWDTESDFPQRSAFP
ncbi:hypothetical protein HX870_23130 [Pseudomonas gingeri]|uniref:hypothetical protein n=1 Tax=Pseudomonas gingeri TaxID=117681 RepID=UPI0015A07AE3|nr:hypothetical protein [Pseudomonas gingeri]NWD70497.1 hypothetical protein [Pseudomonas gingeri]NWD75584.1 hypothetical protein [Pseudomonas gingeri]